MSWDWPHWNAKLSSFCTNLRLCPHRCLKETHTWETDLINHYNKQLTNRVETCRLIILAWHSAFFHLILEPPWDGRVLPWYPQAWNLDCDPGIYTERLYVYYTIDENNDHLFWVLILSIVCLCQGFQLCIVCKIGKALLRKGKQVLIMNTCCGFNIYHIVHTSLWCKQYHVTMKYEYHIAASKYLFC